MAKYKNEKANIDGYHFDSKIEAKYYEKLVSDKAKGLILNFELQPVFELQSKFRSCGINYRAIDYKSDFRIYENNGDETIIDIKGMATAEAKMKRKMFIKLYGYKYLLKWLVWSGGEWLEYDDVVKARAKRRRAKNAI